MEHEIAQKRVPKRERLAGSAAHWRGVKETRKTFKTTLENNF